MGADRTRFHGWNGWGDGRPGPRAGAGLVLVLGVAAACADGAPPADDPADAPADPAAVAAFVPPPSFDCAAPGLGEVETRICADSALATLDLRLDSVWIAALVRARGTAMPADWIADMRAYQRGWIGGRNECWEAPGEAAYQNVDADEAIRRCTETAYLQRIARLEAEWGIAEQTAGPVFWACNGNPANEFVTTYYDTDPEAARVERGDQSEVFLRRPTASGTRYDGLVGKWLWSRGDSATFVWPQTDTLSCVVHDRAVVPDPAADTAETTPRG
jgi:uncharacterized protein